MPNWKVSELVEFLETMKSLRKETEIVVNKFCEVCGSDAFDSPIVESSWKYADLSIAVGAKYFEDKDDYIGWFIYTNNAGEKGFKINDKPITSITDFVDWYVDYSKYELT